mmetsp:Transcript_22180/g.39044  ORF Transcript_22180/g.39044 Transcript_22180/m.39044 type:complete len:100 (+) Transcript_22180:682-981(+)
MLEMSDIHFASSLVMTGTLGKWWEFDLGLERAQLDKRKIDDVYMKMAMLKISACPSFENWLYWIQKTNSFANPILCHNIVKVEMKGTNQSSQNAIIKYA